MSMRGREREFPRKRHAIDLQISIKGIPFTSCVSCTHPVNHALSTSRLHCMPLLCLSVMQGGALPSPATDSEPSVTTAANLCRGECSLASASRQALICRASADAAYVHSCTGRERCSGTRSPLTALAAHFAAGLMRETWDGAKSESESDSAVSLLFHYSRKMGENSSLN